MSSAIEPFVTTALIFGGCCTNVFALEGIVKSEPNSGLIITFLQFLFTSAFAYTTQISPGSPCSVRPPTVPMWRWAFIAFMFFSINMLNNWAFAYNISVPVHIILRSFGSVTTMLAGVIRGKKYSALQVLSVVLLTVGVLASAWADSESKGKSMSVESNTTSSSEFTQGLLILLLAQFMSAYMGAYTEDTYANYKASWTENLFYSHFLSLPLFLPLSQQLREQHARLAATPLVNVREQMLGSWQSTGQTSGALRLFETLCDSVGTVPKGLLFLFTNAVTQLACISGVNLLSAKSSAVTVTIVLNIRKLVSFILSTLIFGHQLNGKMILGSTLVFGSGALYGWETSWRIPQARRQKEMANGSHAGQKKTVEKK